MNSMDNEMPSTYRAGALQATFNRKLQKLCDELLMPYGITKMQWMVIGNVYDAGVRGVRLSELAEQLGTSMSYLTNAVNTLEARGILAREDDNQDTRSKRIVVTTKYRKNCPKIEKTLRDGLRKTIYSKVDQADFQTYLEVMEKLALE